MSISLAWSGIASHWVAWCDPLQNIHFIGFCYSWPLCERWQWDGDDLRVVEQRHWLQGLGSRSQYSLVTGQVSTLDYCVL